VDPAMEAPVVVAWVRHDGGARGGGMRAAARKQNVAGLFFLFGETLLAMEWSRPVRPDRCTGPGTGVWTDATDIALSIPLLNFSFCHVGCLNTNLEY
jgi:hypothetical protein